jgi:glycosyltransferase involved in cell wall biosynthesis
VVFVTRRYWPLCSGPGFVTSLLAEAFWQEGARPTVLTARWQPEWPDRVEHRGTPVVRLPISRRAWGNFQFTRAVAGWLRDHRRELDLVYVSELKYDAQAAIECGLRYGFPVACRAERAGLGGDCHWQLDASFGRRVKRACSLADALIATSPAIEAELIAAGLPRQRIHYLPPGIAERPPINPEHRRGYRQVLADAFPDLALPTHAPLVVYAGSLLPAKGLEHLLRAWVYVLGRWPQARLWLVGSGPMRAALLKEVEALGLKGRVILPGVFDEVEDVLRAADVFVHPALESGSSWGVLNAMAVGLPIVATDIPGHRHLLTPDEEGVLVRSEDATALATAMDELLDDPPRAERLGQAARQRARRDFPLAAMVHGHLNLFAALAAQPVQ